MDDIQHIFLRDQKIPLTVTEWSNAHSRLYKIYYYQEFRPWRNKSFIIFIKYILDNIPFHLVNENHISISESYFIKIILTLLRTENLYEESESYIKAYIKNRNETNFVKQTVFHALIKNHQKLQIDYWLKFNLTPENLEFAILCYTFATKKIEYHMKGYCRHFPIFEDLQYRIALLSLKIFQGLKE